jgi:hypothetical protein
MSAPSSPPAFRAAFDRTCSLSHIRAPRVCRASPSVEEDARALADRPGPRDEMRAGLAPGEDLGSR